ncbi:DUF6183 family protein [Cellulomonas fimi]|uniref:Uncharacterized protein n=1 Tax=Cellulomonas fimi (strain ATCC 484 / DSM 20113 / JCM 1341 / CCUG 24087 / LMG 16345 / NBRC 15513 / NCIMB 8980 / NCTC 7547 / NRS-133) TaxID=590998 RepID=F4H7N0_CELFA|nr:DUF6183 family protein [Cellulomonas fimi]AEE44587.1 hypothetical protein Celf_0446 [Cellulomonas fimi ATCC 484]NNH06437.1 hypothetical protein [Cellulomonas fimi]VEH26704.1 Uncharacterised protein [Cellulomonas fimi]
MVDGIEKIVAELPELQDVTGVFALADARVAQGDAAFAADLGLALARAYGSSERMWQYTSVFGHLLRLLATTAGPENVVQALRLVSAAEVTSPKRDRSMASLLASSHEVAHLAAAFTGPASEELRACLVQELVLRGVVVDETPGIAEWATSPHGSRHPLGWLPRTRSELEAGAALPSYHARGGSHAMPYGPSTSREPAVISGAPVPSSKETTTPAVATAMAAAVSNWADESNGRIEARVFALAEPLDAASVPDALLTLGLKCLHGAGTGAAVSVAVHPPARAWQVLFAAASTGGAYNHGAYGAYGRLAAWRSLAALAGSPEGDGVGDVEARARDSIWYGFEAGTEWFERVAWDIGLAALGPDRRRLAVLAATDTD